MAVIPSTLTSSLGAGEESTYGTAVSRTNWVQLVSHSLASSAEWAPEMQLGKVGDASRIRRAHHKVATRAGGDFEIELCYDDSSLLFLKHALGSVNTSGSGPYTHVFTLGDLPTGLTLEATDGTSGQSEVLEGCKITQLVISVAAGEIAKLRATVLAEDSTLGSVGSPTYSTAPVKVIHADAGTLAFNSVTYAIKSLTLTLDNAITEVRKLGSYLTMEPSPNGFRNVTLDVVLDGHYPALTTAQKAGTQSDCVIVFTSGSDTFTIELSQAQLSEPVAKPVGGPGLFETTVQFVPNNDGSELGLTITVVNGNSSATANG